MKRSLIIVLVFLVLFLFCCTSCTCGETRGLGYCFLEGCVLCFDCAVVDNSGQKSLTKYYLAVEGEDYAKPSLSYSANSSYCEITFSMQVYKEFKLNMEICVVQDGVLLGKVEYSKHCKDYVQLSEKVYYSGEYKADGGEVYCFINKFEANRGVF